MNILHSVFHRFARDERASLSVEAVIVLPLLLWAFLGVYTFFDIYRGKNLSLKANYAVSDLISRETNGVDEAYMAGVETMVRYLTQVSDDVWVRVSVVRCTADCDEANRTLALDWSHTSDAMIEELTDAVIRDHYDGIIPLMALGERVVMVETNVPYTPPFSQKLTGIGERTFRDVVMTRPRFAPQVAWIGS